MMTWLAFILLSWSFGAEIIDNHQDNLWSLSAQKYFWLKEPEIIKKILIWFLPVRAQKRFVLFDWFVFVHFSRIVEFSDYGEIRIQETMCFITWITINAHECFINLFSIIFYDNSLQDLHEVPEHLWSARKRHKCRARGQFMAIICWKKEHVIFM